MSDVVASEVVDTSLPECGLCGQHKDCANCIEAYGRNIDCGWPICRECRDEGAPEGTRPPDWAVDQVLTEGLDPLRLMERRIRNATAGTASPPKEPTP